MKLIEVTTKEGIAVHVNLDRVCFIARQPLETEYLIGSPGARTIVDGLAATPYARLVEQLPDQFVAMNLPEGTVAYVNPEFVMFTTSPDVGTTLLLCLGGLKLAVSEGASAVHTKLTS